MLSLRLLFGIQVGVMGKVNNGTTNFCKLPETDEEQCLVQVSKNFCILNKMPEKSIAGPLVLGRPVSFKFIKLPESIFFCRKETFPDAKQNATGPLNERRKTRTSIIHYRLNIIEAS